MQLTACHLLAGEILDGITPRATVSVATKTFAHAFGNAIDIKTIDDGVSVGEPDGGQGQDHSRGTHCVVSDDNLDWM